MNVRVLFSLFGLLLFASGFSQSFDGYVLYGQQNSSVARLIDKDGNIAKQWSLSGSNGYAMALKPNGNLIRAAINSGNQINGAAVAGKVQEFDPSNNLVWEFVYSTSSYVTHHDICLMPNGNVLLGAWYSPGNAALQAQGYTGSQNKYPTRLIEVQQNGSGGQIVWEWNMLDHFIQDVDAAKPNFGVVADHPERMDINVATSSTGGGPGGGGDWFHVNGIDYNPTLDQIAFTSRYLSELFIIDHSTTTAEAATSSGGNAGKGGDFLYRWGNPSNHGVTGTKNIAAACHDVRWIKAGAPNAGYLQFVNNEGAPGGGTAIDAINPPLNGFNYNWTPGQQYAPATADWRHIAIATATGQSASDRMANGNTFVALSNEFMYEVDTNGTVVWQYSDDPQKAFRYTCSDPGIIALLGSNPCGTVGVAETTEEQIGLFPNPTAGSITLSGLYTSDVEKIEVFNSLGMLVHFGPKSEVLELDHLSNGMYHLNISLASGKVLSKQFAVQR